MAHREVVESTHRVYIGQAAELVGRLASSRVSQQRATVTSRRRIKLSAAAQLPREADRLGAGRESLVVEEGEDALLAQEDLDDLFALLHG